jgi:hypothetical protein
MTNSKIMILFNFETLPNVSPDYLTVCYKLNGAMQVLVNTMVKFNGGNRIPPPPGGTAILPE